jgi:hypothetical protein
MLSLASFASKRADVPHIAGMSPEHAEHNEAVKAQALRWLLRFGLLTGGVGLGAGALTGLLARRQVKSPTEDPDVDLPYPQLPAKQAALLAPADYVGAALSPLLGTGIGAAYGHVRHPKDPDAGALYGASVGAARGLGGGLGGLGGTALGRALVEKLLGATAGWKRGLGGIAGGALGGLLGDRLGHHASRELAGPPPWAKKADWADTAAHALMPTAAGEPAPMVGTPGWMRGDTQSKMTSLPWFYPAAMGVGIGGLWGGHHLVRHLLRKKHKADLDAEVEKAKREYEEAMLGQYDPQKVHKLAAAPRNRLDDAHAALEKAADFNDFLGQGAGAYGALAALLAGLGGTAAYKWTKKRSKAKLLEEALKQRALARQAATPPDVFLHPVPAHPDAMAAADADLTR